MQNYIVWSFITLLYSPVLYQLYTSRWEMIDYTHAYFILPISLWLAWREKNELKKIIQKSEATSATPSLILFVFGILMFIFGWRQDYLFITTLSLIPVLFGAILYLYGKKAGRILLFPIFYLLLMVPPPIGILDKITLPMRYGTSCFTSWILNIFHLPITRDGLLLSIGGHEIYMGPACSGFRSLITLISLGLAYIYVIKGDLKKKSLLFLSIIPLALLGNLIRVISVCLVTYWFGEKIGHTFHDISGFLIFMVLIFGLMGLENFLEKKADEHK